MFNGLLMAGSSGSSCNAPRLKDMEQYGFTAEVEDPKVSCWKWLSTTDNARNDSPPYHQMSQTKAGDGVENMLLRVPQPHRHHHEPQQKKDVEKKELLLPVVHKMQDIQLRSFGRGRLPVDFEERSQESRKTFERVLRNVAARRAKALNADYRGDEDLSYDEVDEDVCGTNPSADIHPSRPVAVEKVSSLETLVQNDKSDENEEPDTKKAVEIVYSAPAPAKFQCKTTHPVSYLNELATFLKSGSPSYSNVEGGKLPFGTCGSTQKVWFVCTVKIYNMNHVGVGRGWNKRDAKSRAAAVLISKISRDLSNIGIVEFPEYLEPTWELTLRDVPEQFILRGGFNSGSGPNSTSSECDAVSEFMPSSCASVALGNGQSVCGTIANDASGKGTANGSVQSHVSISRTQNSKSTLCKSVENVKSEKTNIRRVADFSCEPKRTTSPKPPSSPEVTVTAKRPSPSNWSVTVSVSARGTGTSQQDACRRSWIMIKEMADEVLHEMELDPSQIPKRESPLI